MHSAVGIPFLSAKAVAVGQGGGGRQGYACASTARKALGIKLARPLARGSIIEYEGDRAKVIDDKGGETIAVEIDGTQQVWRWSFEGRDCQIVA